MVRTSQEEQVLVRSCLIAKTFVLVVALLIVSQVC